MINTSILLMMGMITYVLDRKHLLSMLLSLEYMILSMFILMIMYFNMFQNEFFFMMMFLIFSVCEGVLGLSILVSIIRMYGNDYFQSCNLL
nr:NADH dehydrogenase subunit 4L [Raymondia sp. A GC-2023a]